MKFFFDIFRLPAGDDDGAFRLELLDADMAPSTPARATADSSNGDLAVSAGFVSSSVTRLRFTRLVWASIFGDQLIGFYFRA